MLQVSSHSKSIFKCDVDGTYGCYSRGKLTDMQYRIKTDTEGAIESVPVFWHAVSVLG